MGRTTSAKIRTLRKAQYHTNQTRQHVAVLAAVMAAASITTSLLSKPDPIPMRTSILSGQMWLNELLHGNPKRFHEQIGMGTQIFKRLSWELQTHSGLHDSRYISADEQLAIWLHLARFGLRSRMLQERFQHSGDTVSK